MTERLIHQSDGIGEDDDGFFTPRCTCGWRWGPCPDLETLVDVLMDHAAERAITEASDA
jgi:hypothetical protein